MIRSRLAVARMEISLRVHARAVLFLLAVGSVSLLVAAESGLVGIIFSFQTPGVGRWLLTLDADDPGLERQVGQAYRDVDPTESLRHLRRATQLSPASRLHWSDLESACETSGDMQCIDQAAERLVQLCPMVPAYRWLVADSLLRRNQLDTALVHLRRLLQLDPTYAPATWGSLLAVQEPETIFQEMLADNPNAKLKVGFVSFLGDQGDDDAAYRIWRLVAADLRPFPFSSAVPYLEHLLALGRIEEAVNVWQDLERLGIVKRPVANEKKTTLFSMVISNKPL